ncbi:MAG: glucose-1-phosphate thymidylyltransferase [Coriobacteriales bacterium]|nr:glucose-1-phosphate thymidylyltransferase [Coriobacteriales bacterium]
MKALVLSGGRGTRLRPITFTRAKQLVPVANKPILFYAIEAIRDAGITDIGVVVGDTAPDVMAALGDGSYWGVSITYIQQDAPLGLAHAVKVAEEYLDGEDFVMYLGDMLIADGIAHFVEGFGQAQCDAQILLGHVALENSIEFGMVELDASGNVIRLLEKPESPPSDLALVGVYLFNANVMKAINSIEPSPRGELEITDAIQWLVDNGYCVRPHIVEGWWKDTGKLDDILEANRIVLDTLEPERLSEPGTGADLRGRVSVGSDTVIENSLIRGPVSIGNGCEIRDAYIGPYTAIGDKCRVVGSEVEHSILLAESCVEGIGARMTDSLLGVNAAVHRTPMLQDSVRVMIGDNSEVNLGQ